MRNATRAAAIVSLIGVAVTVGSATAHAKGPNDSLVVSSADPNTAVFNITNGASDPVFCHAELHGFATYSTQTRTVAPGSTITFTMINVPAGTYTVRWNCNGGSDGDKRILSVDGDAHPGGQVTTAVSNG